MFRWRQLLYVLALLFTVPLLIGQLPFPNNIVMEKQQEQTPIVLASYEEKSVQPIRALVYFTHTHEAYKPIVANQTGLQAVYHEQTNIASLQHVIAHYFMEQQIETKFMEQNVAEEMKATGVKFNAAYHVARPHVQQLLATESYDYVIDFHRDAVGKDITTTVHEGENYARVAFVVGAAHPQFAFNLELAEQLHTAMNGLVPNISRGAFQKSGVGVDGIYNQDLAPNMLLIELGGIDNTEEEVVRTIAIIAQSLRQISSNE